MPDVQAIEGSRRHNDGRPPAVNSRGAALRWRDRHGGRPMRPTSALIGVRRLTMPNWMHADQVVHPFE